MKQVLTFIKQARGWQLSEDFRAAHPSAHQTIMVRIFGADETGLGTGGEVVYDDAALSQAQVQVVVDAHAPVKTPDEILFGAKLDTVLAAAKAGTMTGAQVQKAIAFILEYMRRTRNIQEP